jgi:lambda family phage tail tape measure protein
VQGNATAQTSFAKLGVTLKDLAHLSEQDLFEKTVKGLANMKDAAERNGLAFQTLGRSIRGVDLKGLAETLDESKGKFDKYASAVEKAHEMSLKLEASHKNLVLNFTVAVIPSLAALYDSYTKVGGAMDKIAIIAKYTGMVLAVTFKEITTMAADAWAILKGVVQGAWNLLTGDLKKSLESVKNIWTDIVDNGKDFVQVVKDVYKANEQITKEQKKQQDIERDPIASYSKQLLAAQSLSKAYMRQAELSLEALQHKEDLSTKTKQQKEIEQEVNKVIEARDKQLAEIEKKIASLDMKTLGAEEIKKELIEQGMQITIFADKYKKDAANIVIANQKMTSSFSYGWDKAFEQYKSNALTAANYGQQSFQAVTNAMDSAIDNFVKKGKLNFKSLAQSIIQDLISIQLKMQANQLFGGVGGGLISGIGDFLKGFSIGGGNTTSTFTPTGSGNLMQSAVGGPLDTGQPSIVGENGPELFVPNNAGTIIPNTGNLSGANLGQTTVNNYNISAIDTKSFEDRIYGSANAIWAANTYAQKNLAINRSRT